MAIRRPDGYVGKPPELGTGVFAMDYGNASSTSSIATYDSGFPVGFSIRRQPATSQSWYAGSRLTGTKSVTTDTSAAEVSDSNLTWDRNDGVGKWSGDLSSYLMWMWKRHAGFDVVTYIADSTSKHSIPHQMGQTPEMMWVKNRDNNNRNWAIYHKGLNGGTNPEQYYLEFDTGTEASSSTHWSDTAPTAFDFTIGSSLYTNEGPQQYIAMLFASVDGISKVGSYTGNGSTGQTITLGFQPRFVIIRKYNDAAHFLVLDTTRGWGSGDDKYLLLNATNAQGDYEVGAPVSNGFTLVGNNDYNNSSGEYIYYAHA
jgi:hypothetical protein